MKQGCGGPSDNEANCVFYLGKVSLLIIKQAIEEKGGAGGLLLQNDKNVQRKEIIDVRGQRESPPDKVNIINQCTFLIQNRGSGLNAYSGKSTNQRRNDKFFATLNKFQNLYTMFLSKMCIKFTTISLLKRLFQIIYFLHSFCTDIAFTSDLTSFTLVLIPSTSQGWISDE